MRLPRRIAVLGRGLWTVFPRVADCPMRLDDVVETVAA
jgi:hypothetical protein